MGAIGSVRPSRVTIRSRTTARWASCWRHSGRHPFRPAHVHFIVGAEGFAPIVTHYFVPGDPYLESDAVFGVKESLIVDFTLNEDAGERRKYGFDKPFWEAECNFVLARANQPAA